VPATGYPAHEFVPEGWEKLKEQGRGSKEFLHFGFGHVPRVCPGKHLGQLEVGLIVGAFLKLFRFRSVDRDNSATAAISTKPKDNALVELEPRRRP
jgi:cytochrome P450